MRIIVTGGYGFIGAHLVRRLLQDGHSVLNIDKLTYAANPHVLDGAVDISHYQFEKSDIADLTQMQRILEEYKADAILHLAAESHVDRSISGADDFMQTNIMGTFSLLQAARDYWESSGKSNDFRFIHVSTDEVYGALETLDDAPFDNNTPYAPNSPYSASKAASDHLARAWGQTYGLPVIITHCSNNYGPGQYPEKLIPLMINHALSGKELPVYGDGSNIRDWLHVSDHVTGIFDALMKGVPGAVYNFGGGYECSNIEMVKVICATLDEYYPRTDGQSYEAQISFVTDRLGHDFRYAICNKSVQVELGWYPQISFKEGIKETILHYAEEYQKQDQKKKVASS